MVGIQASQKPIYIRQERSVSWGAKSPVINGKHKGVPNNGRNISLNTVGPAKHKSNSNYKIRIGVIKMQKKCQIQNHKCATCEKTCQCKNESLTKRLKNSDNFRPDGMATIKMSQEVMKKIMNYISARPAESGGILLGPIGSNQVTDFYFDAGGTCTGASYSPDYLTLSKLMKEKWLPSGIDMKGFVHSHPGRLDRLTNGDMAYINRLLDKNADMDMFIAPIVIPDQYRIRPIVVLRKQPRIPLEARIELF